MLKKWKFHSYGSMDIVIISKLISDQSVQRLLRHMHEHGHTTRQLRCQWRSGQGAANAAITFYDF